MKDFFNFIIGSDFGRIIGLMILSGFFLVLGEKIDNTTVYFIGAILACASVIMTVYVLIVSNIGNKGD